MSEMATPKKVSTYLFLHLVLLLLLPVVFDHVDAHHGLKVGFYKKSCPQAEVITKKVILKSILDARSLAGPLLRMFFHDCFVRGCDGSILLNSTSQRAEKDATPNQSLRGYQIIDRVKTALEQACPGVVSCADIIALVARDVVEATGGPAWDVETGRRDGLVSLLNEALNDLPAASLNISSLKASFQQKGLSAKDLVVLSGAHTIGVSHCASFSTRLYNFSGNGDADSDPSMDPDYVTALRKKCLKNGPNNIVEMDPGSFLNFDIHFYQLVSQRRGLFQSDAALLDDHETRAYVQSHQNGYSDSFFKDFVVSMKRMGRIGVLTGNSGEIRKVCSKVN
ncbi:hypothetical protein Cgig2_009579 [Carnegiea gigantea]|uniref:Peroxidase n=1 Tax=Carnegiea gigantea TaxID=171969 RepID=A0A9Q1QGM6_9CARY|nr:hypothetical protein Cgig2_009579 [Carnegiea gigantea]